jgi:leucyl aminopeptidase
VRIYLNMCENLHLPVRYPNRDKRDMICVLIGKVKEYAMQIPYQHSAKIKVYQHLTAATPERVDRREAIIAVLPQEPQRRHWDELPYGGVLKDRLRRHKGREDVPVVVTDLPNQTGSRMVLARIEPDACAFELLSLACKAAAKALGADPAAVLVLVVGLEDAPAARAAEAVTAALLAASCPLPRFRKKEEPLPALGRIDIYGLHTKFDLTRTRAEIEGNHLARWLTALPPNVLTPATYRRAVTTVARQEGWAVEFMDTQTLKRRKAGAFLAVAQGSPEADAGILRLRYKPAQRKRTAHGLILVGKGICFDTGGVNVKTARYMHGMHEDMEGSAVALGTLLALTRLQAEFSLECWLALAQNHVGPRAYKPNDVVTASNGTTIEVVHTDAEGRMILADTLALAARRRPALIIDYATLTGACIYALSTRYSGAFSNRETLLPEIIAAGRESGERVWPFPADKDFDKALESTIADIRQCTLEGEADHILAARFLDRFVGTEGAWIHIDLAAGNHKGGLAHIPTDTTGFGVRFTLNLLLDRKVLEQL